MALVVGACGGGDDGGGGGGGGGTSWPGIPASAPTLAALLVAFNTSGGTGGGAGNDGGTAGAIVVLAYNGNIAVASGGGRSGIDNNFLTAAVLADNTVTYTELSGINANVFTVDTGKAHLDLTGFDFFLPATATLNLSDAPAATVGELVVRTFGLGDYIRIDGNVVTGRAAADAVDVAFGAQAAPGLAVSVDGNVDTSGVDAAVTYAGGDFLMFGFSGSVLVAGTVDATGNNASAANGGTGGSIQIQSNFGTAFIRSGILQGNGGAGADVGGDASGFLLQAVSETTQVFGWGLRANGGQGGTGDGGDAGLGTCTNDGPVALNFAFEAIGGGSTSASGGDGGGILAAGDYTTGAVGGNGSGGTGNIDGGNGGDSDVDAGDQLAGVRLQVISNGGTGTTGTGGDGGNGSLYIDGAYMVNVLLDLTSNGGTGSTQGGDGDQGILQGWGHFINAQAVVVANGGNATGAAGVGGNGGSADFLQSTGFGESSQGSLDITATGGTGFTGGDGGGSMMFYNSGMNHTWTIDATVNGGATTGGVGSTGGDGGFIDIDDVSGQPSFSVSIAGSANGGNATAGTAGDGGVILFGENTGDSGRMTLSSAGTFTLNGGNATGATGVAGDGGLLDLRGDVNGEVRLVNFLLSAQGGDATNLDGGTGGTVQTTISVGNLEIRGSTLDVSGGDGSTTAGAGNGGDGGFLDLQVRQSNIEIATSTLRGNGGTGRGVAGTGAQLLVTCDEDVDGQGGYLYVDATIELLGGNGVGNGNGGLGGTIIMYPYNYLNPLFFGDAEYRGTYNTSGGNGAGAGNGGDSGDVFIFGGRLFLRSFAAITSNGGTGATGGTGGFIYYGMDGTGLITISGNATANGGAGTTAGGAGGTVQAESIGTGGDIVVTSGVTLRANGGTAAGAAGFIDLDAEGAAGANVTTTGATLQTNTGAGTPVPANITID